MTELAVFIDNNVKSMSLMKIVLISATNNRPVKIMHSLFAAIIEMFVRLQMAGHHIHNNDWGSHDYEHNHS